MEIESRSNSTINPLPDEDLEEQGLRILAKIIARTLAKTRRANVDKACSQMLDSLPTLGDAK